MMILSNVSKEGKLFGLFLLTIISCSSHDESKFYYAVYFEDETTPAFYYQKTIKFNDTIRWETTYRISNENSLEKIEEEVFSVTKGGLKKITTENGLEKVKPYLSYESKECIEHIFDNELMNDIWATKICFLKREDLLIEEDIYKEAYKFKKIKGQIEAIVYYDSNLILLKEEYVSGFITPYRIVRLDSNDLFK